MTMTPARELRFVRLPELPIDTVVALINEPRNTRHMPLSTPVGTERAQDWVRDKDAQWDRHGYGPWAILVDGEPAGWGGFQQEPDGADLALVLFPRFWGQGLPVLRALLERGFGELGLTDVVIALPYSRRPDRAVARFGFRPDGTTHHGDVAFRRYRLTRRDWAGADPS